MGDSVRLGFILAVTLPLVTVVGCATGTTREAATPIPASSTAIASASADAAPTARTATPASPQDRPIDTVRECTAQDLAPLLRAEQEGAGGHLLSLLDLRNVSTTRCQLSGYPRRVTVSEPGSPVVTARQGSFFHVQHSEPLKTGGVTTLGIETDSMCAARPGGGPSGPMYHQLEVTIRGGVVHVAAPGGLDVGCGVRLTEFTKWE